ncbi:hypothetical protein [Sorangium sp. So ce341]|uniref:hypothetical protein n=1 Tax=Sorangium sp. So ce341 TaxID=3133302 RepID=UPI003F63A9B6
MKLIHRDRGPENILLIDAHAPVIAGWSLGRLIHPHSKVLDAHARAGAGGLTSTRPEHALRARLR